MKKLLTLLTIFSLLNAGATFVSRSTSGVDIHVEKTEKAPKFLFTYTLLGRANPEDLYGLTLTHMILHGKSDYFTFSEKQSNLSEALRLLGVEEGQQIRSASLVNFAKYLDTKEIVRAALAQPDNAILNQLKDLIVQAENASRIALKAQYDKEIAQFNAIAERGKNADEKSKSAIFDELVAFAKSTNSLQHLAGAILSLMPADARATVSWQSNEEMLRRLKILALMSKIMFTDGYKFTDIFDAYIAQTPRFTHEFATKPITAETYEQSGEQIEDEASVAKIKEILSPMFA